MSILQNSINDGLTNIYNAIAPIPCMACGECCVSPTITFIEFAYMWEGIFKNFTSTEIQNFLNKPTELSKAYDGNLLCRFKKNNLCSVHLVRSMACRLHGHSVLDQLNIEQQENCNKISATINNDLSLEKLKELLEKLTQLNYSVFDYYSEPYWISGFNIESWLDIIYDPLLDEGPFGQIKIIIKNTMPQFTNFNYKPSTKLKEKIDKITLFHETIKEGINKLTLKLINSIIRDFPLTGTYYLKEAQEYKDAIKKNLNIP